jgi:hypothetical protein
MIGYYEISNAVTSWNFREPWNSYMFIFRVRYLHGLWAIGSLLVIFDEYLVIFGHHSVIFLAQLRADKLSTIEQYKGSC